MRLQGVVPRLRVGIVPVAAVKFEHKAHCHGVQEDDISAQVSGGVDGYRPPFEEEENIMVIYLYIII